MEKQEKIRVVVKERYTDSQLITAYVDKKKTETVLVKGTFYDIFPGDTLILYGQYERNHFIGKYFDTAFYREVRNEFWFAKWLKLYKQLADTTIARLLVDKKGIDRVWEDYEMLRTTNRIMEYLMKQHVPLETIAAIEQTYQWTWQAIIHNPYELLHYDRISFEQIQQIIQQFACNDHVPSKANYYIENLLKKAYTSGHFYLPRAMVMKHVESKNIHERDVAITPPIMERSGRFFLQENWYIEEQIAHNIQKRLELPTHEADIERITQWEGQTKFTLAKNQKEAVYMTLAQNISIVTGGPGVGKTTTAKCMIDLLGETLSIMLVAPTGRAAKRATESTGIPATTVHRALEYNGKTFGKHTTNKLMCDVLVIDESSMIDAPLLLALLEATPLTTRIIFLGDVDQLPSVGAGQILKDLIDSTVVPVTRLTEVFRQAAGSPIITLAYSVNACTLPACVSHEDLLYIPLASEQDVLNETIAIATDLYQREDPFDVQLLIPTYKGPVGIHAVNKILQQALHPNAPRVRVGDYEIRLHDKVIQTKNDYERGIYNGDVGMVTFVSNQLLKIQFQGSDNSVDYTSDQFKELQLAYAVTVHRSQGSEYPFVVIPTVLSYQGMLQKNLLYTAITRAKKRLWMVYQQEAIEKAVSPESIITRFTCLAEQIKSHASGM